MNISDYNSNCDDLTKAEIKWIKELEKVFNKCPSSRLGCYTIGDANLNFFDEAKADEMGVEIFDCNDSQHGVALAIIDTKIQITGLCG